MQSGLESEPGDAGVGEPAVEVAGGAGERLVQRRQHLAAAGAQQGRQHRAPLTQRQETGSTRSSRSMAAN